MKTVILMCALLADAIVQSSSVRVFIADDGTLFHRRDCPSIRGITKIVPYRRDQLPRNAEPCSICRPDDHGLDPAPESTEPPIVIGPRSEGARLLTVETYQEAIHCGDGANFPACMGSPGNVCRLASLYVGVHTPFSNVAFKVFDAKQQLRSLQPPPMSFINGQGISFTVTPGDNFQLANSVTNLVIERRGVRTQPTSASVEPRIYQNGFGVKRSLNRGTFTFPVDVVSPVSDIDLLIAVERDAPIRCTISAVTLGMLR